MEITIRRAERDDAPIIGRAVAMGIGYDDAEDYAGGNPAQVLAEVARQDDSQYSWKNAFIAETDGIAAGAVVGYDGARLEELRRGSLKIIRKYHPDIEIKDDETDPGEFYIDSLAVLPEYRGQGIGSKLLDAIIAEAAREGSERVGLLVDFANPDAERLYLSLGFRQVGERPFFGHMMKHLQMAL